MYLPCLVFYVLTLGPNLFDGSISYFEPWSQVDYIKNINYEDGITQGTLTHLSRFAVVFPAYWFSEVFNIDILLVYTAYVKTTIFLTALCWINISSSKYRSPLPQLRR